MKIPEYVQRMIAATNGRMWVPLVGRLEQLPIPAIPIPAAATTGGLLLDIGAGWGRWMVAGARKGYTPVGIDIRFEAAQAAREVLRLSGATGYVVVADLANLPFRDDLFDVVWSFSTIQHTHRDKARRCLDGIGRCLRPGGLTVLEFPNRAGLWNRVVQARRADPGEEDIADSWCVRYYALSELREEFRPRLESFAYSAHCYFGIGLLPIDLAWVPWRYRPVVLASLGLTAAANTLLPPLRWIADSVYCRARKRGAASGSAPPLARLPGADPNLAILPYLRCPRTGQPLEWDPSRQRLLNVHGGLMYPVRDGIPILLSDEAEPVARGEIPATWAKTGISDS
jgi:SAM-dependent methyltransferase/uncharacterized protein YbaR (Trm112 family)